MFAALMTEAGEIVNLPRAEGVPMAKPYYYRFEWSDVPFDELGEKTVLWARAYTSREGGQLIGQALIGETDTRSSIRGGDNVKLDWQIRIGDGGDWEPAPTKPPGVKEPA